LGLFLHEIGERDAGEQVVDPLLQCLPHRPDAAGAAGVASLGVDGTRIAVDLEGLVLRRRHDVPHRYLGRDPRQEVAAVRAPDALDQARAPEPEEDLLYVIARQALGFRQLSGRNRPTLRLPPPGQVQDDNQAVFGPGGDTHGPNMARKSGRFKPTGLLGTRGPLLDLAGREGALRLETRIAESAVGHVDEVLLPGQERTAAYLVHRRRVAGLFPGASQELMHDPARNPGPFGGIDEAEQDHVAEQYPPVPVESAEQPLPVEAVRAGQEDVRHVRAIVAITLHDERLGPERFLRWTDADGEPEDLFLAGMLEPLVIHRRHAVAGTEDHVDESVVRFDLGQPVRR